MKGLRRAFEEHYAALLRMGTLLTGRQDVAEDLVFGEGPVTLVVVHGWVSHLEVYWEQPRCVRFMQRYIRCSPSSPDPSWSTSLPPERPGALKRRAHLGGPAGY